MTFLRREFSVVLLLLGMAVVYAGVLISAGTSGAQTSGDTTDGTTATTQYNTQARTGQSDEGCSDPVEVFSISDNTSDIFGPFTVEGQLFRVRFETTPANDGGFGSTLIEVDDENLTAVTSEDVRNGESGTIEVNEGPGEFFLNIATSEQSYDVVVEDCAGSNGGNGGGSGNVGITERRNGDVIINVPRKPLPPTGGLPVYLMVAGSILAGAGLLAWRFTAQRGRQR